MQRDHPAIDALPARIVDCGRVVTGGGVTLCIDVGLHLLERLFDARVAAETPRILEYTTDWDANDGPFAPSSPDGPIAGATGRLLSAQQPTLNELVRETNGSTRLRRLW